MRSKRIRDIATGAIAATVLVAAYTRGAAAPATPQVRYPAENASALLAERKQQQLKTVDQFKVFYQFQFEDKVAQSGITFVNHIVDDAARNYVPAHYDHGTGIAVADVDGDGLYEIGRATCRGSV